MTQRVTCPHCETALLVSATDVPTVTCPRCLGAIPNPAAILDVLPASRVHLHLRPHLAHAVDDVVRRDRLGTGVLLVFLVVLGGVGAVSLGLTIGATFDLPIVIIPLMICFVALVIGGVVLARRPDEPVAKGFGWMMLVPFVLLGALIVGGTALCLLLVLVCVVAGL